MKGERMPHEQFTCHIPFCPIFVQLDEVVIYHGRWLLSNQELPITLRDLEMMIQKRVDTLEKRVRHLDVSGLGHTLQFGNELLRIRRVLKDM